MSCDLDRAHWTRQGCAFGVYLAHISSRGYREHSMSSYIVLTVYLNTCSVSCHSIWKSSGNVLATETQRYTLTAELFRAKTLQKHGLHYEMGAHGCLINFFVYNTNLRQYYLECVGLEIALRGWTCETCILDACGEAARVITN